MSSSYARYVNVVRDRTGQAVANATIRVYVGDSTQLAQLYDGAGNTVAQPLTTDADGVIRNGASGSSGIGFKVAGGRYRLEGTGSGQELVTIRDLRVGTSQGYDVADIQAIANSGVYASTSDGISNTTDGDFFWVPESGELTLYRNNAGSAAQQATYPDLQAVADQVAAAKRWASETGNTVADAGGSDTGEHSAKEYAQGDLEGSGGSAKAWAIDSKSPDGSGERSAKENASDARLARVAGEYARDEAESAQSSAEDARDTAQAHRDDAQSARDSAQAAESGAVSARDTAQQHRDDAQSARDTAESHKNAAQTAEGNAASSANLAEAWATGTEPGGTGTKSAEEWAGEAKAAADTLPDPSGAASGQVPETDGSGGYTLTSLDRVRKRIAIGDIESTLIETAGA